ncbi:hypothetical protein P9112_002681 [Eukaryota sp. TZLM1-RC]
MINCLTLQNRISSVFPENNNNSISESTLLSIIGDLIANIQTTDENTQVNMSDALSLIPTLSQGLDVNPIFSHIKAFEFSTSLTIFDILGLDLCHAWIIDPNRDDLSPYSNFSYNVAVDKIINSDDMYSLGAFLEDTSSQITEYGLECLSSQLKEGSVVVFFRNNHFNTLLKLNGKLYILLSDMGFADSSFAWECLVSVSGNNELVQADLGMVVEEEMRMVRRHEPLTRASVDDNACCVIL